MSEELITQKEKDALVLLFPISQKKLKGFIAHTNPKRWPKPMATPIPDEWKHFDPDYFCITPGNAYEWTGDYDYYRTEPIRAIRAKHKPVDERPIWQRCWDEKWDEEEELNEEDMKKLDEMMVEINHLKEMQKQTWGRLGALASISDDQSIKDLKEDIRHIKIELNKQKEELKKKPKILTSHDPLSDYIKSMENRLIKAFELFDKKIGAIMARLRILELK